jgi:hypothetical protein
MDFSELRYRKSYAMGMHIIKIFFCLSPFLPQMCSLDIRFLLAAIPKMSLPVPAKAVMPYDV